MLSGWIRWVVNGISHTKGPSRVRETSWVAPCAAQSPHVAWQSGPSPACLMPHPSAGRRCVSSGLIWAPGPDLCWAVNSELVIDVCLCPGNPARGGGGGQSVNQRAPVLRSRWFMPGLLGAAGVLHAASAPIGMGYLRGQWPLSELAMPLPCASIIVGLDSRLRCRRGLRRFALKRLFKCHLCEPHFRPSQRADSCQYIPL